MIFSSSSGSYIIGNDKERVMHGRAMIWNFSSRVQLDISQGSVANKNKPPRFIKRTRYYSFMVTNRRKVTCQQMIG